MCWIGAWAPSSSLARRAVTRFRNSPIWKRTWRPCVRLIRDWPGDVVFCLETKNSVMGKIVLRRDEIALLPEPE